VTERSGEAVDLVGVLPGAVVVGLAWVMLTGDGSAERAPPAGEPPAATAPAK